MCGICGYINLAKEPIAGPELLAAMCQRLYHRGPDDQGLYVSDHVALGHRRLSIIDLAGGHQPLFNEDRSIVIIFNGEIYNFPELKEELIKSGRHQFYTNTDTEVIVHLYEDMGTNCLQKLNGMFAFALWDGKNQIIFCARDRMGKKPLYYTVADNLFIFASELKALMLHPAVKKEISLSGLSKYLAFEYVPAPFSILENVFKLEPGHFLLIDLKRPLSSRTSITTQPYWDISFNSKSRPVEELKEEFLERFKAAVRRRLISDVPVGVFASGGIDSSSVVAMMAQILPSKSIKTFCIGFEEKSFDESDYASTIARVFDTDHRQETLKPETMREILPEVCSILDEPFADASIIPTYLLSRFTRRYVTVALGGDGGDELFAGYDPFVAHYPAKYLGVLPKPLIQFIYRLSLLLPVSTRNMSLDFKLKQFFSALHYPYGRRHFAWLGSFPPHLQPEVFSAEVLQQLNGHDCLSPIDEYLKHLEIKHELDGIIYLYCKLYLQDDILVKVDRASMAHSLEVRAPFLDVNIVEFMGTVPNRLKLHNFTTKYLLKQAMSGILPKHIIHRPKKGFGIPVTKWLKEHLKPQLLELFSEQRLHQQGLFNYLYVKSIMDQHFQGKRDNRKQLWTLFMFQNWYENYYKTQSPGLNG